jgi:hypothetical protein
VNWASSGTAVASPTSASTTVTVDGNKTVTANLSQIMYSLTANNDGHGSVTLAPIGGSYASGSTVTLTPVQNIGYQFSNWSGTNGGNVVNSGGLYTIVMNNNKTVMANFVSLGILGDSDDDAAVTSTDALIVLSCDVGINTSQFCPMNCSDVNSDGLVNSSDALIILSFDIDMSVPFPVGQPACPSSVTACKGCNP